MENKVKRKNKKKRTQKIQIKPKKLVNINAEKIPHGRIMMPGAPQG